MKGQASISREIKFRIWDHAMKRMNDWDWVESSYIHIGLIFNNDFYTIMFFVGLHDSDGNEIYDGDIISYRVFDTDGWTEIQKEGVIDFSKPYKGAMIDWIESEGEERLQDVKKKSLKFTTNIIVIGNKFEDPELLNKKREINNEKERH